MTRHWTTTISGCILPFGLLLLSGITDCSGDDEPKTAGDSAPKTVKIPGTFESIRQFEVTAGNEHLTELRIERIVPSGSVVTEGQALVWFETEPLDDKLREAETDLELAKLSIEGDQFAHAQFLKQQTLDKQLARRTRDIAQQEYDNYQKVDRERTIKSAEFSLKSSKFALESATEEYRQLEQMYKEDDLTEESEEIVLRRAKHSMESATFSLERAKIQHDRTLKQTVPRSDATEAEKLSRALMAYDKSMHTLAAEKRKQELELERKLRKLREQTEDVAKMRAERKQVVLKSESDGIFVYGQVSRGKPPAKPVDLKKGSSASGKQIIGTVVDPSRLQVRVDLPEEHLATVRKGGRCKLASKAMPNVKLDGVVKSVAIVPFTVGKYDCVVNVRGKGLGHVLPAMTCELTFTAPKQKDEPKKDRANTGKPKDGDTQ